MLLPSRTDPFYAAFSFSDQALLLPKLRSHFAEFLYRSSLYAFMYLHSTTCVGFLYGFLPIVSFWGYILSQVYPFKSPRILLRTTHAFGCLRQLSLAFAPTHLFSPFSY